MIALTGTNHSFTISSMAKQLSTSAVVGDESDWCPLSARLGERLSLYLVMNSFNNIFLKTFLVFVIQYFITVVIVVDCFGSIINCWPTTEWTEGLPIN